MEAKHEQDGGVVQAGDATPKELPITPDSDDEAGQVIAVSRQCWQNHTTRT